MRRFLFLSFLLLFGVTACGVLSPDPTLTPIIVTATSRFVVVTNTPTPEASPVLAPTLVSSGVEATVGPPTLTPTTIITMTPTFTPTPTDTPVTPGVPAFQPVGVIGGTGAGAVTCASQPSGGFATIYNSDSALAAQLSCPIDAPVVVSAAYQPFERGLMIWVSQVGTSGQPGIYVLYTNNTYSRFIDTWRDGVDPSSTGQEPPDGYFEPVRGFGKVWRESGGVRDSLGWATSLEIGGSGTVQVFERGEMVYISQTGQTYIVIAGTPGTWTSVSIAY